jgi:cell division protein ZapA
MGEQIKVEILGQSYSLRAGEDRAYIEELASYVDAKMRAVLDSMTTADASKAAILAALNIADELFKLQRKQEQSQGRLEERVGGMARSLDEALDAIDGKMAT